MAGISDKALKGQYAEDKYNGIIYWNIKIDPVTDTFCVS
jgi:hypothetical protein